MGVPVSDQIYAGVSWDIGEQDVNYVSNCYSEEKKHQPTTMFSLRIYISITQDAIRFYRHPDNYYSIINSKNTKGIVFYFIFHFMVNTAPSKLLGVYS